TFPCPTCGEEISMVLDLTVNRHTYIEDCEVCCNPIEISYTVQDDALVSFAAKTFESIRWDDAIENRRWEENRVRISWG
ncbi:MAG TPA: CPXCG motif-containing cysteine-rich protein, partial [Nitrospiraceae bacterium]|nr:CPXCG motif-containing cysteine-rich protein [Nitrospiraceae bacterium]